MKSLPLAEYDGQEQTVAEHGTPRGDGQPREITTGVLSLTTGRVAAIGFCFGAAMALELGRAGADLKAIVGFHLGLGMGRPEDTRNIKGSVLLCVGSDDPFASAEQRLALETEMTEAGVADWSIEVYGGVGHSFTNPEADDRGIPALRYDRRADERSWQSMLRLFAETIGSCS